jgi:putative transposase
LRTRDEQQRGGGPVWCRPRTIGKWRNRFIADGIKGLYDEMRTGRPRTVDDMAVAELITKTLARKPKAASDWTVRAMADETGIAKSTVHRLFQLFGLQPHRTRSFRLSTDPFFIEKLHDVVGLYLNPPDKAVVLCVDQKVRIQTLERTQLMLPTWFGYFDGVTDNYQRHSTSSLFAELNVLNGAVFAQRKHRHRHPKFLGFLCQIDANVPPQLDIHLIVDNYGTHNHPKVKAWLARHPRWHIHFTPTYASWLKQVGRFFALTQGAVRRSSFFSTADLVKKTDRFIRTHKANSRPFVWTATADSIRQTCAPKRSGLGATRRRFRTLPLPKSQMPNRPRLRSLAIHASKLGIACGTTSDVLSDLFILRGIRSDNGVRVRRQDGAAP